jgi:hypothetical protein
VAGCFACGNEPPNSMANLLTSCYATTLLHGVIWLVGLLVSWLVSQGASPSSLLLYISPLHNLCSL